MVPTGAPLGKHLTDVTLSFTSTASTAISPVAVALPAEGVISNHLNAPGSAWWRSETLELGCKPPAGPDEPPMADWRAETVVATLTRSFGEGKIARNGSSCSDSDGDRGGSGSGATGDTMCGCHVAECMGGRLVAESMRWYASADVALISSAAITKGGFADGDLTARALKDTLGASDALVRLERVPGAVVRQVIEATLALLIESRKHYDSNRDTQSTENGAATGGSGNSNRLGSIQASSGIRIEWRLRGSKAIIDSIAIQAYGNGTTSAGTFQPLDVDNGVYTIATTTDLLADPSTILGRKARMLNDLTLFATPFRDAVPPYIKHHRDLLDADVPTGWGPAFNQGKDIIAVSLGVLIQSVISDNLREEYDHAVHTVDLINDKNDGFFDDLLENVYIDVEESIVGCAEHKTQESLESLRVPDKFPNLTAIIGPTCSTDLELIARRDSRAAEGGFQGVIISHASTAPALGDELEYPKVARTTPSEVTIARAMVQTIRRHNWTSITVLNDDTVWGNASRDELIKEFKEKVPNAVVINEADTTFSLDAFDDGNLTGGDLVLRLAAPQPDKPAAKIIFLAVSPRVQDAIFAYSRKSDLLHGKGYAWLVSWVYEAELNIDALLGSEGLVGVATGSAKEAKKESITMQYDKLWELHSSAAGCGSRIGLVDAAIDHNDGSLGVESHHQHQRHSSTTIAGSRTTALGYCNGPQYLPAYSASLINAVLIFAKALDKVYKQVSANGTGEVDDPNLLHRAIQQLDVFEGVGGDVKLDPKTQDLLGAVSVINRPVENPR